MKKILLVIAVLGTAFSGFSQYYYTLHTQDGQNPGNLNKGVDQPGNSGTEILASKSTPTWSTVQSIPFSFMFNGSSVTQYKVSSTGILTFTTSAGTPPSSSNSTLPDASIPDNSVVVWGIESIGSNDVIGAQTFGTAPNRQHWVNFTSYGVPGASGTYWTYWSIVLEETTNNVYIVDRRTYNASPTMTLGLQFTSSNAIQVAGAPNTPALSIDGDGNNDVPDDNVYYQFSVAPQPSYDLAIIDKNLSGTIVAGSGTLPITGIVKSLGSSSISTFDLAYSLNGGSPVVATINHAMTGATPNVSYYNFTHPTPVSISSAGVYDLKVWVENIDGGFTDANPDNDTISGVLVAIQGTSGTKTVVFEEFTGAWCGFCPDGALYIEDLLNAHPNTVVMSIHGGAGGTYPMDVAEGQTIANTYSTGYPSGMVDRYLFTGNSEVAFSRSAWISRVAERNNAHTPVNLTITPSYNSSTRKLDVNLKADFVDYAGDDVRMNLAIIEDVVTGTGTGYDQRNYYSSQDAAAGGPSHPFYNEDPYIVGYEHKHVLRSLPTGAWGDQSVITDRPAPGSSFNKDYSITIPSSWDAGDINIVAFVSYYDEDPTRRNILNGAEAHMLPLGVDDRIGDDLVGVGSIYPNPSSEIAFLPVSVDNTADLKVELFTLDGRFVSLVDQKTVAPGEHTVAINTAGLESGVYVATITLNGERTTRKVVVTR